MEIYPCLILEAVSISITYYFVNLIQNVFNILVNILHIEFLCCYRLIMGCCMPVHCRHSPGSLLERALLPCRINSLGQMYRNVQRRRLISVLSDIYNNKSEEGSAPVPLSAPTFCRRCD